MIEELKQNNKIIINYMDQNFKTQHTTMGVANVG